MKQRAAFIEVAVALPVFGTFTYAAKQPSAAPVGAGQRVLVPFGRRRVTGYVLGETAADKHLEIKPITDVLDDAPFFPPQMIPFFRWIADYYLHPLGDVIRSALPAGVNVTETAVCTLTAAGKAALLEGRTDDAERAALVLLQESALRIKPLARALDTHPSGGFLRKLREKGWIAMERKLTGGRVRSKTERFVRAAGDSPNVGKLTAQREKILHLLQTAGEMSLRELIAALPTTATTVRAMAKAGVVEIFEQSVYRDPFGETVDADTARLPTEEQHSAISRVLQSLGRGFGAFLLAGVTGSGKTEVYMQIAERAVQSGKTVLVLVPEIALISQMERRFRARFGDRIAVLHSGLSDGERYDQWLRIRSREAAIVLGARSAIFAPLIDIGLIVVDEEHDSSYKQETNLRYNARDLAAVRAKMEDCVVLFGSATPSVQAYYNANRGKLIEIHLEKRVEERPLPEITVVDLRESRDQRGIRRFLSDELSAEISAVLDRGEQALLFLNRRGFASFAVCAHCGEAVKCKHCDISMTLHQAAAAYKCHYCGFVRPAGVACGSCGADRIRHLGLGTEKIEETLKKKFPEARVARMDRDTTGRKGALLRILKDLHDGRIDLLVGTQMVAKGHDFPNITLVGIICADLSLSLPDFRASERSFQLLAQVAGRAGRGQSPGRVILQTYNPEHFSIVAARNQDFKAFYSEEIRFRQALNYPPFSRMVQFMVSGPDKKQTAAHALRLGELCRRLQQRTEEFSRSVEILGPIEAALTKIAGRYRWQLLTKGAGVRPLHRFARALLSENQAFFNHRGVHITVDVDPLFVM
ncbi:MAG: primosomal protein N' [Deltaproteobacteria bacterium SG8_13]|nr:MAG: primosomal protein N' [Deltaproteobacteria bacterium SG8_13]